MPTGRNSIYLASKLLTQSSLKNFVSESIPEQAKSIKTMNQNFSKNAPKQLGQKMSRNVTSGQLGAYIAPGFKTLSKQLKDGMNDSVATVQR